MTIEVITWLENELAKLKGNTVVKAVETDVTSIGSATLNYIKTNGLQDLYQIAVNVLTSVTIGSPWSGIISAVESQAVADGKSILAGSSTIVTSIAQSDLLAAGKLLPSAISTAAAVTSAS